MTNKTDIQPKARRIAQTNIHFDEGSGKIHAANFQPSLFIPAGSEIEVLEFNPKQLVFIVSSSGKKFFYFNHKQAAGNFTAHIQKVFANTWDSNKIGSLSSIDQEGISKGKPLLGMSKDGVFLAMGYPPSLENPDLQAFSFTYWVSRFNRLKVIFNSSDLVIEIKN